MRPYDKPDCDCCVARGGLYRADCLRCTARDMARTPRGPFADWWRALRAQLDAETMTRLRTMLDEERAADREYRIAHARATAANIVRPA